jgi:hypothetical protein
VEHFIQQLDYSNNPIFNSYPNNVFSEEDNLWVYELINKIDNLVIFCTNEKIFFYVFYIKIKLKVILSNW